MLSIILYSNESPPSVNFVKYVKYKMLDDIRDIMDFSYICIDNRETLRVIQEQQNIQIKVVPTMLITKDHEEYNIYEGKKCNNFITSLEKKYIDMKNQEKLKTTTIDIEKIESINKQKQKHTQKDKDMSIKDRAFQMQQSRENKMRSDPENPANKKPRQESHIPNVSMNTNSNGNETIAEKVERMKRERNN